MACFSLCNPFPFFVFYPRIVTCSSDSSVRSLPRYLKSAMTALIRNPIPGWCIIYTRSRQEKKLAAKLKLLDIECYLPLTAFVHQWHDRKKVVAMPLFPSYVFVYLASVKDLYRVVELDGFVRFIKFENQIATVADTVIQNLRLAVENGSNLEVTTRRFAPGERLQIEKGSLAGFTCEVVDYNGKHKALVRINLLNRYVLVDLPLHFIAPADSLVVKSCRI